MNWFQGNIAEAVAQSKAKNAIFVVFVEGKDENSQKLIKFINEEKIREKLETDDFVAIRIENESQAYIHFASIFKIVPVPSIFFIGKSGAPLEIGTGVIASADELQQKIDKVLVASNKSTPAVSVSSSFIAEEQRQQTAEVASTSLAEVESTTEVVAVAPLSTKSDTAKGVQSESEIICEDGVCYRKPKEPNTVTPSHPTEAKPEQPEEIEVTEKAELDVKEKEKICVPKESSSDAEANARLEETRMTLEQKRRERIEQEKQLEKENELRRRREGKDLLNLQQWQKEQELKELKDNLRRERLAEQEARERVRAQIAADRAERAQKTAAQAELGNEANASGTHAKQKTIFSSPQPAGTDMTRLQFRLSNGTSKSHSFNCQETLSTVVAFVKSELLPGTGIKNFVLATTYPKRELTAEHENQNLIELGLFPSAVILVIGKQAIISPAAIIARSGGIINILSTLFWTILSPISYLYGFVMNIGNRNGAGGNIRDANVAGTKKRVNQERNMQNETAKRRNLDRFMGGPSTSQDAKDTHTTATDGNEQKKPHHRYGSSNVHRLNDNRKDSDDENATWNGNSTQQQ